MKTKLVIITSFWLLSTPIKAQLIDFNECEIDSVTDIDGNVYKTILFEETWWMADNLRTKHYNDGSSILQMTELMDASDTQNDWSWWIGAGRWGYPDFDSTNYNTYGLIYSWDALANTKNNGVCPEGWSLADTGDWFNMARLIVGDDNVIWEEGERSTPQGGTETYYEVSYINKVGRYLKSDNGELWKLEPTISQDCNSSGMNITPNGEISTAISGFGTKAEFWTPNYVHSDSTGQGRRYILFNYDDHILTVSRNHRDRLRCARCVKHAHVLKLETNSITLDSAAQSSDSLDVTANYYWSASTNSSWLSVNQTVDSSSGSLIITAISANLEAEPRTDTVFVSMSDAKTKTILVTQAGSEPLFSVSDTILKVMAAENSTVTFSISSNVDWVVTSSETWLKAGLESGSGNAVIELTAEANTDTITRMSTITIESEKADTLVYINVMQSAKAITASTSLDESFVKNDVILYPNPVIYQLKILSDKEVLKVDVVNLSGSIVLSQQNTNVIDMQNLTSGLYLFRITTVGGLSIQKVLKD